MFSTKTAESLTRRVIINDISPIVFDDLVTYCYWGEVMMNSRIMELMVAADKYNIEQLVEICESGILGSLSVEHDQLLDIMIATRFFHRQQIFIQAKQLIISHPILLISKENGPTWTQLKTDDPDFAMALLEACLFRHPIGSHWSLIKSQDRVCAMDFLESCVFSQH
jgi:hypothetical protein